MTVFNKENTDWQNGGSDGVFLGQRPALFDSINNQYPEIFKLYKTQKSIDWSEDEISLEQSRLDLINCPTTVREVMLLNLAFQWELDSVASRSIAPIFAPFVSNSQAWAAMMKQSEIEILHPLTYSEIIRNCVPDPQEVFEMVMKNEQVLARGDHLGKAFAKLAEIGAKYTLGMIPNAEYTKEDMFEDVMVAYYALYMLERIQFMSSFAATFAVVSQGWFQGIGLLVQKIMQDEVIHYRIDEAVIKVEQSIEWKNKILTSKRFLDKVKKIFDEVVGGEFSWNAYLFSEGRSIVGLNENLLNEWVMWNAQDAADFMGIELGFERVQNNPLLWFNDWLNMDAQQVANQESDNQNYRLNVVKNDVPKGKIYTL